MKFSHNNSLRPYPYHYYYVPVLLIVILGLLDTLYLTYSHYRNYTDITYSSFCALSQSINCDTVSQSPWSIIFGLPVSVWGFFGYFLYFIVLLFARKSTYNNMFLWNILVLLSLLYSLSAIFFTYISTTKIHAYCIMCILSYAISFSLLYYSWFIRRRFCQTPFLPGIQNGLKMINKTWAVKVILTIFTITIISTRLLMPPYWLFDLSTTTTNISSGKTTKGNPWIGAKSPTLTINEYSDYRCFQCNKMHYMLRRLIAQYPDKIRLIHHHYPMDNKYNPLVVPTPFHEGSGQLAKLAILASLRDKFWKMNDLLYETARKKEKEISLYDLADKIDLDVDELSGALTDLGIAEVLRRDIWQGLNLRIIGTPSFVINGEVYEGYIPAKLLSPILQ